MQRFSFISTFLLLCTNSVQGQLVAELPANGGLIGIRNVIDSDVTLDGMDFISFNSGLIPIPDSGGPEPFLFILSNTTDQITVGVLGPGVTLPAGSCTVLDAGVQAEAEFAWVWGSIGTVAQPFERVETVCAVPEPSGSLLLSFALCAMIAVRRSSSSTKV